MADSPTLSTQEIANIYADIFGLQRRIQTLQTEHPSGGRSFALAITKLDEAGMWLNKANTDIH